MGFLPTDDDLKRTIKYGISGTAMPTFKKTLSEDKIESVITYLKSFSREWKHDEKHCSPIPIPARPDWMRTGDEKAKHIESGKKTFATHCATCHGVAGKGDGPAAISLKDIWEYDIRPADLSAKHHKSGDSLEDLYRTISMGLNGTPMIGFLGILDEEQIWEVTKFVRDLKYQE